MKAIPWLWSVALLVLLVIAGCKGREQPAPAAKEYPIKGKVVAVDPNKPAVMLDHEDIPGLMKAMKMEFAAENPKVLEGLQAGDQVEGRLKVEDGQKYVITELKKR